jgi:mRNA-degrading endonuclease RelE of RelBE toxin-antitoxin system
MLREWWNELATSSAGRWRVGYSEPVCRALSRLENSPSPPDFSALKALLSRLQSEGVPSDSKRIPASIPLYRIDAGDYRLQVTVNEAQGRIDVERLKLLKPP